MSKPNLILRMLKMILKAERAIGVNSLTMPIVVKQKFVVISNALKAICRIRIPRNVILKVLYIFASPMPAPLWVRLTALFKFFLRKDNRFHANLVERVRLGQIEDIELNSGRFLLIVYDFEVVPLRVPFRVQIVLQPQIVLNVVHFGCFPQIATFKSAVKNEQMKLVGYAYRVLGVVKVALSRKFRQIFEEKFVNIRGKVPLASFCLKNVVCLGYFLLGKQNVGVELVRRILLIVILETLTADHACVGIIHE